MGKHRLGLFGSGFGEERGACECGNKPVGSIK
jgi:hypothetical protein